MTTVPTELESDHTPVTRRSERKTSFVTSTVPSFAVVVTTTGATPSQMKRKSRSESSATWLSSRSLTHDERPSSPPRIVPRNKTRINVQVVACPSAFPFSKAPSAAVPSSRPTSTVTPRSRSLSHGVGDGGTVPERRASQLPLLVSLKSQQQLQPSLTEHGRKLSRKKPKLLDWQTTVDEVRALGATAFVKQQKKNYLDDEYLRLTGRPRKQPKTPLPIVRGLRHAAARREAQQQADARDAGLVRPTTTKRSASARKQTQMDLKRKHSSAYGPAPSIGFMPKGILQVKTKK